MKKSMSSREMMVKAGKEVAKSVVVAKSVEAGARRLGLTAAASTAGLATWAGALVLARKVHPEYLDPVSANQINRDPEFVMNVHCLVTSKEIIKIEDAYEHLDFYVQHFARFSERVIVRKWLWPYWERMEKFDMSQHIFVDSSQKDHASLEHTISASLTQGMNPLIPLWKLVIFTNFSFDDGTKGTALLFKYHHCMGDGFSFARTMFSFDKNSAALPPPPGHAPRARLHNPGSFGKFVEASTKLLGMKDDQPSSIKAGKSLKPLDTRIACYGTSKASIKDIKKGAKHKGHTVNDVLLAALAAALRNYKVMKGDALTDPLAGVWVALRPITEAFSQQDLSNIDEPGNKSLGCVYVRLPVSMEYANRADRVDAVAEEISELKGSPEPLLAQKFMQLFGLMPTTLSNPIWDAVSNKISVSVSTLPGVPPGWRFCGMHAAGFSVFVPPVGTISTFALLTAFNDKVTLSLAMDGQLFTKEDSQFICNNFDKELGLLVASMQPSSL